MRFAPGEGPGALPGGFGAVAAFAAAFFAVHSLLLSFCRPARGDCLLLEGERPLCPLWREVESLGALCSRAGGVTGTAEPLAVLTPSP